jgi:PAS domain S-box-containing protein
MRYSGETMAADSEPRPSSALEIEWLRALANAASEGLAIHKDGVVVIANDVFAHMVGKASAEDLVGTSIFDYATVASREIILTHIERNTETPYQVVGRRADGSEFPAELQAKTIVINGETLRVSAILDLSERQRLESELAKSKASYDMLFAQAADGIGIAGRDGTILSYNPSVAKLLGYDSEELVGRSIASMVSAQNQAEAPIRWQDLREGRPVKGERSLLRKDGSVVQVELNSSPLDDGRILTIFRDVTERNQLREQLLQSQKLESVGRLAGGIAHDFNNLLTVVMGNADLLQRRLAERDQALAGMAADIAQAAERGSELTSQLLTFSRRQLVERAALSLNDVVRESERMMRRLIGEDVEVHLDLDPELPATMGNRAQMLQVLMNLVINSRDAMPNGGRVSLQTRAIKDDPKRGVCLTVSDTGIGMSKETLQRAFEPFFSTKPVGEGTGLGLSTVYGIVTQSGGQIELASEQGKGSVVTMLFPVVERPARDAARARALPPAEGNHGIIVLVEDEPAVAEVTRRILQAHGYTVHVAPGPNDALSLVDRLQGFDLLITDVVMPDLNGYELAERIKQARPALKVLYASGYADDRHGRSQEVRQGVARFLAKPFSSNALLDKVREILSS